jgi:hypothetical protein
MGIMVKKLLTLSSIILLLLFFSLSLRDQADKLKKKAMGAN